MTKNLKRSVDSIAAETLFNLSNLCNLRITGHLIRHSITIVIANPITTIARRMKMRPTRCAVREPT